MALDTAQRAKIRGYLGYSLVAALPTVESVLDLVVDDAETEVEAILADLADLDSRLSTTARDVAGLTKVGSNHFAQGRAIADLRTLARASVQRLSFSLSLPVQTDRYGTSQPQNFQFYN